MSILENYRKTVGRLLKDDALDSTFPKPKIDEETRATAIKRAGKFRGAVRISHGLFYTDKEREKRRKEMLKVKLP